MGEYKVEGGELKKLVKAAKKEPVAFGFAPGKSDDTAYLAMDKLKPASVVGRDTKDNADSKYAFGTATVAGKVITLTCLREMPQLAKQMKKYLKSQKVMLNVVVLDKDGKPLESDIEDGLPDDPELMEGDGDAPAGQTPPPDAGVVPGSEPGDLVGRLRALREAIAALPEAGRDDLSAPFGKCVTLVREGDPAVAAAAIERLEKAVQLLTTRGTAPPPPPPAPDPQALKLVQLLKALRERIGALADADMQKTLLGLLGQAAGHLQAQEVEAAMDIVRRVGEALATARQGTPGGEGGQGQAPTRDAAAPDGSEVKEPATPEEAQWDRDYGAIRAQLLTALSQGLVEDVDELRRLHDFATGLAADGEHAKALLLLPQMADMLNAGRSDGQTAFESEIPDDVQPFAIARMTWSRARGKMMSEVGKVISGIRDAAKTEPALAPVLGKVSTLTDKVAELDDKLEQVLEDIVNAETIDRPQLKAKAADLAAQYLVKLDEPFFQDIDANSGFGSVAVASTGRAALASVQEVLDRN
jgi:hypothetical protein